MQVKRLHIAGLGERDMHWPDGDNRLWKWVDQVKHADEAIGHCRSFRSVVQAGGACGVWPLYLSKYFSAVYTFEPQPDNFAALTANCASTSGIFAANWALGFDRGPVRIEWAQGHEDNFGAQYVRPGGSIPSIRIDDLGLYDCDLICLDVEGAEGLALRGAIETIKRTRPVVMYEEAGHVKRFNTTPEAVSRILEDLGYKRVSKQRDDVVMVCD